MEHQDEAGAGTEPPEVAPSTSNSSQESNQTVEVANNSSNTHDGNDNAVLYQVGDELEVVDKDEMSKITVGKVTEVRGRWLKILYHYKPTESHIWCHELSDLVHPTGWGKAVGHDIEAPVTYNPTYLDISPYEKLVEGMNIQVGMKLEAVDPLNFSEVKVYAATIRKVLKGGFVMVKMDYHQETSDLESTDWFCYYICSPYIFPCGFCKTNGIKLIPPKNLENNFDWETYLQSLQTTAFQIKEAPPCTDNMIASIEAVDLDTWYLELESVPKEIGWLFSIHFDGHEVKMDQWMNLKCPDILDSVPRDPSLWDPEEVARFLHAHGWGKFCFKLFKQNFNGLSLLEATENEISELTDVNVGPNIFAVVQDLIAKYETQKSVKKNDNDDAAEGDAVEGGAAEGGVAEGDAAEGGAVESGAAEGDAAEGGAVESGAAEGDAAEGGAAEVGSAECDAVEGGAAEGGVAEGGAAEGGTVEGGAAECDAVEGGAAEGGVAEGGVAEGDAAEGGAVESGAAEGDAAEGGAAEVGSAECDAVEGGAAEGGVAEGGAAEGGTVEGGAAECDAVEGGAAEGGVAEGGVAEGGVAEGDAAEGGAVEGGAAEGDAAEGGAAEVGTAECDAVEGGAAEGGVAEGSVAEGGAAEGGAAEGGVAEGGAAEGGAAERDAAEGGAAEGDAAEGEPSNKRMRGNEPAIRCKTEIDNSADFKAASVDLMEHAPLSGMWGFVKEGLIVEVVNNDANRTRYETVFWPAKVIKVKGYLVLLRYEGFENDSTSDFWIHICSPEIHHVGWCCTNKKPCVPPKSIEQKINDCQNFLTTRSNVPMLPFNFREEIENSLISTHKVGDRLEVLYKRNVSLLKLAEVRYIIGHRLYITYCGAVYNQDFWFHEQSDLVHPMGWAKTVGHKIDGGKGYKPAVLPPTALERKYEQVNLEEGMMLEARNPLNPGAIGVGRIMKVLKFGYVMVRLEDNVITSGKQENGWHCYHITSPYVLPCGFCEEHGIPLTPPKDWKEEDDFHWESYLIATEARVAPLEEKQMINHGFEVGMKVEAAYLLGPDFILAATISNVAGHLLKIQFDGFEEHTQWVDARSVDIYPVGWCELVDYFKLLTRNIFKPM
ncbi:unnamed protein product [Orchesella dallaii]|uniref:Uncharacterized protein n=1 Tax=Orchesella dallaii TaxID=48710 RepID=A0ABP1PW61_9HEXA